MKKTISILSIVVLMLSGCATIKSEPMGALKIGIMPSMDSAPIIWALEKGYFESEGVSVEIIVYSNGNDRDTQIQTQAVDAVITDVMGLVSMKDAGYDVEAISGTETAFSLVSKSELMPNSSLNIAMAEVSVTQYAADLGLQNLSFEKTFVDALPQRLEMVGQGLVDGSIIPEPMASLSTLKGLKSTQIHFESPNVLMWNGKSVMDNKDSIDRFYKGYNQAVETIKEDIPTLKKAVVKTLGLDESILPVMVFPEYQKAHAVSRSVFDNVVAWMKTTLNKDTQTRYEDVIADTWFKE